MRNAHANLARSDARRGGAGMTTTNISRRDLLKTSLLLVSFRLGAQAPAGKTIDPREVDSFLALQPDGSVVIYTGKVDLGTGLRAAIRQMAAEELELPSEKVTLVERHTALTPDQRAPGGPTGLTPGGVEVRQAPATAPHALPAMPARAPP